MKQLTRVLPEDFDAEALLAAACEGRLYVDAERNAVNREQVKVEVRAYVARIRSLATHRYGSLIDELWEEIFQSAELMEVLMPKPKARKCKAFDKYGVMRLVGVLRVKGVYEDRSDSQFDALLEEQGKDSPYRRYLGQGLGKPCQLEALRLIVERFEKFNNLVK